MIKIENINVSGWEASIRGMRNPYDSWNKSDSTFEQFKEYDCGQGRGKFLMPAHIGENDLNLMQKLTVSGDCHAKFARMIIATMDVKSPFYWWKEADTYKVGTVANSCSTMHTIAAREFTIDDFSHEHLFGDECSDDIDEPMGMLNIVIDMLNQWRRCYLQDKEKDEWWQLIQLLPMSYNQKRTVQFDYQTLRNIYHQRKGHKLDEWKTFCEAIESLPYAKELIMP